MTYAAASQVTARGPTYRLIVRLDAGALQALSVRSRYVAIAKSDAARAPKVLWLAVPPSPHVVITWRDVYGVYASGVPHHAGSPIEVIGSCYPARDRSVYVFGDGAFAAPTTEHQIPKDHYDVRNAAPSQAGFGLVQAATVNSATFVSPVNFAVLPPGGAADFVGERDLLIWSDSATSPTVVSRVPANALLVPYGDGITTQRCRYDAGTGEFVLETGGIDARTPL